MDKLIFALIFFLGAIFGSFLSYFIYRFSLSRKNLSLRSFCPQCGAQLRPLDLIPILSYLWLKGECRYCKRSIHWSYFGIEVFTGFLFLGSFVLFENFYLRPNFFESFLFLFLLWSISFLLSGLFFLDLKYLILPDIFLYPLYFLAFALIVLEERYFSLSFLVWPFLVFSFFYLVFLLTKGRGLGLGDVKFSLFLGLLLQEYSFLAIFLSFNLGAIIGLVLIFLRKKSLKSQIPFGPFLIFGLLIAFYLKTKGSNLWEIMDLLF